MFLWERLSLRDRLTHLGVIPFFFLMFVVFAGLILKMFPTPLCIVAKSLFYGTTWTKCGTCTSHAIKIFTSSLTHGCIQSCQTKNFNCGVWPSMHSLDRLGTLIIGSSSVKRNSIQTNLLSLFRYYFVWWSKNVWKNVVPSVSVICCSLDEVLIPLQPHALRINTLWVLPSLGSIKINGDGSYSADQNKSGIGDVFWDHSSNIILHFSKQIATDLAIQVEVMAIRKGLLIAAASRWSSYTTFYIKSDSTNIVSWFKNISQTP